MILPIKKFYEGMKIFSINIFKLSPEEKRRKLLKDPQVRSLMYEAFRSGRYSLIEFPVLMEELSK